ncbi:hypothetical protein CJJ07_005513 [Candidozyma auris]|nr:hypothetical protein CJJ07_005513 [[Candida] auris]QEL60504.1 hypothetical protein CJJ09_002613 [[Candida] auris]
MAPSVSVLNPPKPSAPRAVALRLNSDALASLQRLQRDGVVPKLVVKNGQYSIKVNENLVYPCSSSTESLRFDVYAPSHEEGHFDFAGTVSSSIHARSRTTKKPNISHREQSSLQQNPGAYAVAASDSKEAVSTKFLALLALGPITKQEVEVKLNASHQHYVSTSELTLLFQTHTQVYSPNSKFTESDTYPSISLGLVKVDPDHFDDYVILKDKAYKEFRPWKWSWYTPYERSLIIENAHHALSRLGYSDTHPLRRRVTEKSSENDTKKPVALGGGLLTSKDSGRKVPGSPSPNKRSGTASPRMDTENKRKRPRNDTSPLKNTSDSKDQRYVASSSSSSSSEDERQSKKQKKEGQRSNSSGSNQSTFSNATSYTSPSSINEEQNDDSEDDMKLSNLPRASPALPSKPIHSGDKRQQYYKQLAQNFYTKYSEYKHLHEELVKDHKRGTVQEKKRRVMKLFEMHNLLAGWKRKLWDYHNESNMAQGIMHLSRHKKTNSGSGGGMASAPQTSQLQASDRFSRSGTASPSVGYSDKFASGKQTGKRTLESRSPRPKMALDY